MAPHLSARPNLDDGMSPSVGYARMSGCVLVVEPHGRIRSALSGSRALLGSRPDDRTGRPLREILGGMADDGVRALGLLRTREVGFSERRMGGGGVVPHRFRDPEVRRAPQREA